jgi:RND family efflux transporter MFP subunit
MVAPVGILTLLAALGSGCQRPAPPPDNPAVVPVEILVVEPHTLDETTNLPGVLEAFRAVDVVSEVSGKIATLRHDVGDKVPAATPLASLDKEVLTETFNQADAAFLAAEARFELAQVDYGRDSTLFASGDIAKAVFDASRMSYTSSVADLKASRAARELAARNLRETDIRAPFGGIVTRRFCEIGTFVTPGAPLFRIVDIDSLRLVLSVAQQHVAKLEPGHKVAIVAEALGDQRFTGRIRSISPEADKQTRTFPVEAILRNPPRKPLRDGLVVRATLILGTREKAISIPREAIIKRTGGDFVFVVTDSVAHRRSVVVGSLIGDRYVIEEGLKSGDPLVIVGAQNLKDGTPVAIEQQGTPADTTEGTES